jgi:uncharacterized Ntn-hydrolase superfamily protein
MPRARLALLLLLPALVLPARRPAPLAPAEEYAATFSIAAYDPKTKSWGVAVASKYLAVGNAVPWAKAGAGAVATQALVNATLGPRGLELLGKGKSAEEALKELLDADKGREHRQVGLVDAKGEAASHTGKRCTAWAGGRTGKHYACQGNILAGEKVVEAMCKAYEANPDQPFAWRLQDALEAGDRAGGDKRGKQAAAIVVVRAGWGPNGFGDRWLDLRVDDHKEPVQELGRILALQVRRPKKR